MRILITGATGYVGGRLVPRLLAAGHDVRCMVRDASRLQGRPGINQVETVTGDVLDEATLAPALAGVDVAYYLVHSMGSGHDFHARDARAARALARRQRRRACDAWSISARWAIPPPTCPSTCDRGSRQATRCGKRAYRSPSSAPP